MLEQVGGYKLPFMVLGSLLFVTSLSNCLFVPLDENAGKEGIRSGDRSNSVHTISPHSPDPTAAPNPITTPSAIRALLAAAHIYAECAQHRMVPSVQLQIQNRYLSAGPLLTG